MLRIAEIFESIHGEINGHHQGRICTFIRTTGCNLQCPYCFGVVPGRKIPKLITSRSPNLKLPKVYKGLKLMTFDPDMNLVETEVTHVDTRKVRQWYRLTIEGVQYFVTPEHPFFTNKGLVKTENLKIGDEILHASFKDKLSFNKKGNLNPMKNPITARKRTLNTDYKKIGKKISFAIKQKQLKGLYISPIHTLSEEKQKELRDKISNRMKGDKNPNWKGGRNKNYVFLKNEILKGKVNKCGMIYCENSTDLHVHHIDGDKLNDKWENLQVLCRSCHSIKHENGYSFWEHRQNKLSLKSQKKFKTRLKATGRNGMKVEAIKYFDIDKIAPSIRPKPLKVYTISCEPYNSYLLDYMWVHNCDTPETQYPKNGKNLSISDILIELRKLSHKYICVTGGEPLLYTQTILPLFKSLYYNDYLVSVETNGTIDITPFFRYVDSFVLDFKVNVPYYNAVFNNYLNLRNKDVIKFVVGSKEDVTTVAHNYSFLRHYYKLKLQKPIVAFSPIISETFTPKILFECLKEHEIHNSLVSLQIHKFIGFS